MTSLRLSFFVILALVLSAASARAEPPLEESVVVSFPPEAPPEAQAPPAPETEAPVVEDPYTVADIHIDMKADASARVRDDALMRAQRIAYARLCARLGVENNSVDWTDDDLSALVRSFEIQKEHLSAVRYIGVFTIRFNPPRVQEKMPALALVPVEPSAVDPERPVASVKMTVRTGTLPQWMQIKRRLGNVPLVSQIHTTSVSRDGVGIDLSYEGDFHALRERLTERGLILRQTEIGLFELYDGSLVSR